MSSASSTKTSPEASYRSLVENAPIGIFRSTPEGRIVSANPAFVRMLGYDSPAEVLRLDLGRDVYADPGERARIIADVGDQDYAAVEVTWKRRDGRRIAVRMAGRAIRDDAGRPVTYETLAEDITERKQAEDRFRALVEHASDIIVLLGPDGRVRYSSPSSAPILGYDGTEELGRPFADFVHPDDLARVQAVFQQVMAEPGRILPTELRARHKDGSWRDLEAVAANRLDHPAVGAVVITFWDITERKRAERVQRATLQIAEAANTAGSLQDLLRAVHGIVGDLMPARNFFIALYDPATDRITFPYFVDEHDPPPPPRKPALGLTELVLRTGQPLLAKPETYPDLERRGVVKELGTPSVDWLGVPLKSGDRTIGVIAAQTYTEGVRYGEREKVILQFVSTQVAGAVERRRAEEARRASEERFRSLIENSSDVINVIDADGTLRFVSQGVTRVLGYRPDELVGRNCFDYLHPEDLERARTGFAEHLGRPGGRLEVEFRLRHKDGTWRSAEAVTVNHLATPGISGIVFNYRDVTERKRAERAQQAVLQVAEAAHTAPSLQHLLRAVHAIIGELMPAKNLYIALYDEQADLITFPYHVDELEPPPPPRKPARGLTEYVMRSGLPLLAKPDVYPELERRGEVRPIGAPSVDWLGVPPKSLDRTIGVIAVQTYTEGTRYTEREKVILQFVSTQIASAIERRRAEEALRESEERYRRLVESSPDAVWVHAGGRTLYANPACARLLGVRHSMELLGRSIFDFVPEEARAIVAQRVERVEREGGVSTPRELQLRRSDGPLVEVEVIGIPLTYQGQPAVQAVIRDISARKQAEAQLQLLAQAVKSTRENISITDLDGRFTFVNQWFLQGYGYQEHEVLGHRVSLIDSPRNPPGLQEQIRAATAAGGWSGELWNRRKDGGDFLISLSTSQVRDAEGRVIGLLGVWSDITELTASERKFRELVESAPVGIYQSTAEGRIQTANTALARMLGYDSVEELQTRSLTDIYYDLHDREELIRRFDPIGRASGVELMWKKKDGTPIRIQLDAHTVRDAGGRTLYYEGFVRDVTERARLEEQLRQAQKMEAIGQLAGGIAHDFNNLLTAILGFSSLLLRDKAHPHPRQRDVEEIRDAATRAAALTQQLLAFSRKQVLQPAELDLNEVVQGVETMLRRVIGEHIELATVLAPGLGAVLADHTQLEQVIVILAVNARDAMPRGGTLTIETAEAELDPGYVAGHPGVQPGRYVLLAVSDTGIGMDAETRARIFEPFFTTKGVGVGTGLGLATVYGVVQQSGGHIAVYSEVGRGSTFKIYLPRVEATSQTPAERLAARTPAGGSETVLLVEDEKAVRTLARQSLEQFGYRVLESGSGQQALLLAQGYREPIDLLLTDVVMPGMSGRELAERLTRVRPGLRVLYTSGYTDSAIVHHGVLDPGVAYLPKPYTPDAVARKVRELLDAR